MTEPYFRVGEEVILQTEQYPEFNGDAVVLDVCKFPCMAYLLTISTEDPDLPRWRESCIKKKHKGAGDFSEMLLKLRKEPADQ